MSANAFHRRSSRRFPPSGWARPGLIAGGAVLCVGLVLWFTLRPAEEDRVRARFDELAELVSGRPSPGLMGKAKVVGAFRDLFLDPVVVEAPSAPVNGVFEPDRLAALFLSALDAGVGVEVSFATEGIEITGEDLARVDAKVSARIVEPGGPVQEETGPARVELRKVEGSWKFSSFEDAR